MRAKRWWPADETQIWQLDTEAQDGGSVNRVSSYRAPDLGCLELEQKFGDVKPDGSSTVECTYIAQSVSRTEPANADMDAGDSYVEVLPSEFEKKTQRIAALADESFKSGWCKTHDCEPLQQVKAAWDKSDKEYQARRAAKQNGGKL